MTVENRTRLLSDEWPPSLSKSDLPGYWASSR